MHEGESFMSTYFNEAILSLVGVLGMIATAFVAARKSAEKANQTASKTLNEVLMLKDSLELKFGYIDERYHSLERRYDLLESQFRMCRTEVDMLRGAVGTRKDD